MTIKSSTVFATLMIVVPLMIVVATRLGWVDSWDTGARLSFVLSGVFLMMSGNAIPKRLASLAGPDPSRVQSFRRFAGWTWVLTGLALVIAWLTLPLAAALTSTFVIIPAGMGLVALRCVSARAAS
jgi:hypothetical protein